MLDGELDDADIKAILSSIQAEDVQAWNSYSAVGDLIRSADMVAFHSPSLLERIDTALQQEPTVVAPTLATSLARKTAARRLFDFGSSRRFIASIAAVGFFSFAMHQAIPPLDTQVQMVRTQATVQSVTDQELALWQEYFMAHQQNSVRSGLSGVSPIARVEAERPLLNNTERVMVNDMGAVEWMNVWEPAANGDNQSVQFNYVSSSR